MSALNQVFDITTTDSDHGKHKFKNERSLEQNIYDPNGNLTSSLQLVANRTGTKFRLEENNTYNDAGNLLLATTSKVGKGRFPKKEFSRTSHTYNDQGNKLSSLFERDYNGDGQIDSSFDTNYSYDHSGKVVESTSRFYSDKPGIIESSEQTAYTYDPQGNLISTQTRGDENNNGSFNDLYDYVIGTSKEFNTQGNVIREREYYYQGFGGYELVTDFSYDDKDRLIEESYENFDAYGDSTSNGRNSYEYDDEGRLVSSIQASGSFGELSTSVSTVNSYDEHGNLTLIVNEEAYYDIPSYRQTTRNTYDNSNNLITSIFEIDNEADGQIDSRDTTVKTYDRQGKRVSSISQYDADADGGIDETTSIHKTYDSAGHLIASDTQSPFKDIAYRSIYSDQESPRPWAQKIGNDILKGSNQRDTLKGGAGDDWIFGLGGHDWIVGNSGNDVLLGGNGYDTLTGGSGEDEFVFQKSTHKADRIIDFNIAEDSILIRKSGFELDLPKGLLAEHRFTIGSAASDRTDRFIYNPNNATLLFDADGSRKGNATVIAYFGVNIDITADNILIA